MEQMRIHLFIGNCIPFKNRHIHWPMDISYIISKSYVYNVSSCKATPSTKCDDCIHEDARYYDVITHYDHTLTNSPKHHRTIC